MGRFRLFLIQFMQGRNGQDALNKCLFWLCLALSILSVLTPGIGKAIFYYLAFAVLVFYLFRFLSRNVAKRNQENARYLQAQRRLTVWVRLQKRKWTDRKTHVFRKCPHCHATIRFPKRGGTQAVGCPKCHREFQAKL